MIYRNKLQQVEMVPNYLDTKGTIMSVKRTIMNELQELKCTPELGSWILAGFCYSKNCFVTIFQYKPSAPASSSSLIQQFTISETLKSDADFDCQNGPLKHGVSRVNQNTSPPTPTSSPIFGHTPPQTDDQVQNLKKIKFKFLKNPKMFKF